MSTQDIFEQKEGQPSLKWKNTFFSTSFVFDQVLNTISILAAKEGW